MPVSLAASTRLTGCNHLSKTFCSGRVHFKNVISLILLILFEAIPTFYSSLFSILNRLSSIRLHRPRFLSLSLIDMSPIKSEPEGDTNSTRYVSVITSLSPLIVFPRIKTVLGMQQDKRLKEISMKQPVDMVDTQSTSAQPSKPPVDYAHSMTEVLAGLIIQNLKTTKAKSTTEFPSRKCLCHKKIMDVIHAQPSDQDLHQPLDRYLAERPAEQCWSSLGKRGGHIATIKAVGSEPVVDNRKEGPIHIDSVDVAMAHSLEIPEDVSFVGTWCVHSMMN